MKTERTTARRRANRASYDRDALNAILDEALVSHLGVIVDGYPSVVPMLHVRVGDTLYLHGHNANRAIKHGQQGPDACVSVMLLDGLVVTRAAFHMSVNYRSAVVYGKLRAVDDLTEKALAMNAVVQSVVPGIGGHYREPSERELGVTKVAAMPLAEASVKVRTGGSPDGEDAAIQSWAGIVPARLSFGPPQPFDDLAPGVEMPAYIARYRRPGTTEETSS